MCSLVRFMSNDTTTTEVYTLSLHDALPICGRRGLDAVNLEIGAGGELLEIEDQAAVERGVAGDGERGQGGAVEQRQGQDVRSEEHTSELQSQSNLVCRLLLEKKNRNREYTL